MELNQILHGDVMRLKELPDNYVNCCVTSPLIRKWFESFVATAIVQTFDFFQKVFFFLYIISRNAVFFKLLYFAPSIFLLDKMHFCFTSIIKFAQFQKYLSLFLLYSQIWINTSKKFNGFLVSHLNGIERIAVNCRRFFYAVIAPEVFMDNHYSFGFNLFNTNPFGICRVMRIFSSTNIVSRFFNGYETIRIYHAS